MKWARRGAPFEGGFGGGGFRRGIDKVTLQQIAALAVLLIGASVILSQRWNPLL